MIGFNQSQIIHNPYQQINKFPRVLCVCTAGALRSPTTAVVLSQPPFNKNTRACGVASDAIIPLSHALIVWADEIVCMEEAHKNMLIQMAYSQWGVQKDKLPKIIVLDIEDRYEYRNESLIEQIKRKYEASRDENSK